MTALDLVTVKEAGGESGPLQRRRVEEALRSWNLSFQGLGGGWMLQRPRQTSEWFSAGDPMFKLRRWKCSKKAWKEMEVRADRLGRRWKS